MTYGQLNADPFADTIAGNSYGTDQWGELRQASLAPATGPDIANVEQLKEGQNLLNLAIVANLSSWVMTWYLQNPMAYGVALIAGVLAWIGIWRIGEGRGTNPVMRIATILLTIVPLLNLYMIVRLNARASALLKAAGYKIGLLGAR